MHRIAFIALALAVAAPCLAQVATAASATSPSSPVVVKLPPPGTGGGLSVEQALSQRRSLRAFAPGALTLAELAQLCWSAQGITDAKGHRTVPSAMATYPLDVYVVAGNVSGLAAGVYRYRNKEHDLERLADGDARDRLVDQVAPQLWIRSAPVALVVTGTLSRMGKRAGNRGATFMAVEAGEVAQSVFLQAVSLGLGSTYVGGFNPDALRKFLNLPAGEEGLAILPIGREPAAVNNTAP